VAEAVKKARWMTEGVCENCESLLSPIHWLLFLCLFIYPVLRLPVAGGLQR